MELLPWLTDIINKLLAESTVHDSFKRAIIRPPLKKPGLDKNLLQNYCPVSNLPFLSKVIERAVAKQMDDHLTGNALLDPFQSAYQKYHSTETALLKVHSDLEEALGNGHAAVFLMLDLSAAFDTLEHQIV